MTTDELKNAGWTEGKITGITVLEFGEHRDCIRVNVTPLKGAFAPKPYRVSNIENARMTECWDCDTLDEALEIAVAKRNEFFN
jgi:hypothetical protein